MTEKYLGIKQKDISVNLSLAEVRGLSYDDIRIVETLHKVRDRIHKKLKAEEAEPTPAVAKFLEDIEETLGEIWFGKADLSYYKFWKVPKCTCPKIDNADIDPSGAYYYSIDCPLHGKKARLFKIFN